jgi:hypothetical protein
MYTTNVCPVTEAASAAREDGATHQKITALDECRLFQSQKTPAREGTESDTTTCRSEHAETIPPIPSNESRSNVLIQCERPQSANDV